LQFYFTIEQGVTLSTLEYITATWECDRKREERKVQESYEINVL